MKRYLPGLLIIAGIFILTTCGNEPPAAFYDGTPEDSAAIFTLLTNNSDLTKTSDAFTDQYIALALAAVNFGISDSYFQGESTIVKQHADSCGLKLTDSTRFIDLWYAKDTTCTVTLFDTFTVFSKTHADFKYTGYYYYDDTINKLDTVIVSATPFYDSVAITGNGSRLIFFEPLREAVEDPETGDTVMAIKEPMEWVLKRIAHGTYSYPNKGADGVPVIDQVILKSNITEKTDTIWATNYDTTFTGHAMNRFKSIDSLFEYAPGETLQVKVVGNALVPDTHCVFFASCNKANRAALPLGTGQVLLSGSGIVNLYIEMIAKDVYYYLTPEKPYNSTIWLISIKIGGGA